MSLQNLKVLVCAGSGGVGKTTLSAALGLAMARKGKRVMVLTIDPSKRLAQALGFKGEDSEVLVPHPSGNLSAGLIQAEQIFDQFVRESCTDPALADKLLRNRLYRQLSRSLSGSQEFTSLEKLLKIYESGKYDIVLLDTPPAEHAMDFLKAPERIYSLFQDSITKWFIQSPNEGPLWQRLMNRGTQTMLNALERITGASFIRELSDFFQSMSTLQSRVTERSMKVHRLLTGHQTGFLLVTGFDQAKLREATDFSKELKAGGYQMMGVIVNRAFPLWLKNGVEWSSSSTPQERKLLDYYQQWRTFLKDRLEAYERFTSELGAIPIYQLLDMQGEVFGLESLEKVADELVKKLEGNL